MSDEDPLRNNCLEPRSLVLTRSECFYCFGEEGKYCYTFIDNFGIKSCDAHFKNSVRDCKAYMHRTGMVRISDLTDYPEFQEFLEILSCEISVKRTNGTIEDGWVFNVGESYDKQIIGFDKDINKWVIPVRKAGVQLFKRIHIDELLLPEVLEKLPLNFKAKYDAFIALLSSGIYKAENDMYVQIVDNNKSTEVPDDSDVVKMGISGGQVVRYVLPPST